MLICMRTTILLPDELYAEVRQVAQDEDATITSVIERSLRTEIRRLRTPVRSAPYRVRPLPDGSLRRGVDLDDNADLAARMERADQS